MQREVTQCFPERRFPYPALWDRSYIDISQPVFCSTCRLRGAGLKPLEDLLVNKMKKLVVSTFAAGALLVGPATAASATGIQTDQFQAQECTGVLVVCTQKQSLQNGPLNFNFLNIL